MTSDSPMSTGRRMDRGVVTSPESGRGWLRVQYGGIGEATRRNTADARRPARPAHPPLRIAVASSSDSALIVATTRTISSPCCSSTSTTSRRSAISYGHGTSVVLVMVANTLSTGWCARPDVVHCQRRLSSLVLLGGLNRVEVRTRSPNASTPRCDVRVAIRRIAGSVSVGVSCSLGHAKVRAISIRDADRAMWRQPAGERFKSFSRSSPLEAPAGASGPRGVSTFSEDLNTACTSCPVRATPARPSDPS